MKGGPLSLQVSASAAQSSGVCCQRKAEGCSLHNLQHMCKISAMTGMGHM